MMQAIHIAVFSNIIVSSILMGLYYYISIHAATQEAALGQLQEQLHSLGGAIANSNKQTTIVPAIVPTQPPAPKTCQWTFKEYVSSPWEKLWIDHIDEWKDAPCKRISHDNNAKFAEEAVKYSYETQYVNIRTKPNPEIFSKLVFENCNGKDVEVAIEPLAMLTRNFLVCVDLQDASAIVNKSYMVVDWDMVDQVKDSGGKVYYFDAGASTYTAGAGGASQNWFVDWIEAKGLTLSGIFAWELTAIPPTDVWNQLPGRIWPIYHWYNIPVATTKNHHTNPLTILKQTAKPEDLVIFKLDIDHIPTETAIINQLFEDHEAASLIDVLFWEYHVYSEEMKPYTSDTGPEHRFPRLYELFVKLRKLGIRAHSWV